MTAWVPVAGAEPVLQSDPEVVQSSLAPTQCAGAETVTAKSCVTVVLPAATASTSSVKLPVKSAGEVIVSSVVARAAICAGSDMVHWSPESAPSEKVAPVGKPL